MKILWVYVFLMTKPSSMYFPLEQLRYIDFHFSLQGYKILNVCE